MKSKLKAPGTERLKLKYDEPLQKVAFNFNLRHYTWALRALAARLSRPLIAVPLPAESESPECQLDEWSLLAAPLPPHVHVLGVSADRPPGAPPLSVSAGACPLWLRQGLTLVHFSAHPEPF